MHTTQALEALITSSAAAKLPHQQAPLKKAGNGTHASRPAENPQYPMTCNKHSLISSSFNPLLKPILTCDLSWGILPFAASILSSINIQKRWDIRNNGQTPISLLQPVSIPDTSETRSHEILVCWSREFRLIIYSRVSSASPGDTVHLCFSYMSDVAKEDILLPSPSLVRLFELVRCSCLTC